MAEAEAASENRYGLVYQNAITRNVSGKVNIHPVNYKLHGLKIAANVYTPANYSVDKKYAAILVAHPNGGVKEQVAGLYAQRLAELGYIPLPLTLLIREQVKELPAMWTCLTFVRKTCMAWLISLLNIPVSTRSV